MCATATALELVVETDAHEGPVYAADEDALYFTSVRRDRVSIKRLALADRSVSVVREDANNANGMTLDRDRRLLVCEQGTLETPARIARLDRFTGALGTVVEGLSSPNDVVVARDGAIWFTDPTYGWLQGFRPPPETPDRVYRYDPHSGISPSSPRRSTSRTGLPSPPTSAFSTWETTEPLTVSSPSTSRTAAA